MSLSFFALHPFFLLLCLLLHLSIPTYFPLFFLRQAWKIRCGQNIVGNFFIAFLLHVLSTISFKNKSQYFQNHFPEFCFSDFSNSIQLNYYWIIIEGKERGKAKNDKDTQNNYLSIWTIWLIFTYICLLLTIILVDV